MRLSLTNDDLFDELKARFRAFVFCGYENVGPEEAHKNPDDEVLLHTENAGNFVECSGLALILFNRYRKPPDDFDAVD
jgi:hypothetical protein